MLYTSNEKPFENTYECVFLYYSYFIVFIDLSNCIIISHSSNKNSLFSIYYKEEYKAMCGCARLPRSSLTSKCNASSYQKLNSVTHFGFLFVTPPFHICSGFPVTFFINDIICIKTYTIYNLYIFFVFLITCLFSVYFLIYTHKYSIKIIYNNSMENINDIKKKKKSELIKFNLRYLYLVIYIQNTQQ